MVRPGSSAPPRRAARQLAAAYGIYQALALIAWWHLLAGGMASTLPAGSADPAQEAWFLAWVPHALGAGTNPFVSHEVFAPAGVNMLANTSAELLGLLLSPITVTAGPVAALGVAAILAPAASATAACALAMRYVRWRPAAFLGGLCYGFGPFCATDLRYGHVNLTWLAVPPLVFLCLDELFVRRRHHPAACGAALGVLAAAQFFISTELLAVTALMAAAALAVAGLAWPRASRGALDRAWPGLAAAAAVAAALLAYPLWMAVAGPRHTTGPIWPHIGDIATNLSAIVQPHAELAGVAFISGGNGGYLGITLVAVLLAGAVGFWRSRPLRLALTLALVALVASLGYRLHVGPHALAVPLPATALAHLPLLDSIAPERFAAMTDLFAGLSLAIVVDHVRGGPGLDAGAGAGPAVGRHRAGLSTRVLIAIGVAAVALAPLAMLPRWPYPVTPAPTRPPLPALAPNASGHHRVLVVYPDSSGAAADEMMWQAEDGFSFQLPDGYAILPGPGGRAVEAPPTNALWLVLAAASVHRLGAPLSASTLAALRRDLHAVHADAVVLLRGAPDGTVLRRDLAALLGPPRRRAGGWVWPVRP